MIKKQRQPKLKNMDGVGEDLSELGINISRERLYSEPKSEPWASISLD